MHYNMWTKKKHLKVRYTYIYTQTHIIIPPNARKSKEILSIFCFVLNENEINKKGTIILALKNIKKKLKNTKMSA